MKLTIELVPQTSWNNNLRSLMQQEGWNDLRKIILKTANRTCVICKKKGALHCHEVWEYDDDQLIQKLVGIIPICELCHAVKHIGFTKIQSSELYDKAVAHFMKINNCNRMTFEVHKNEAFAIWERRSQQQWRIDIGNYEGVNFLI